MEKKVGGAASVKTHRSYVSYKTFSSDVSAASLSNKKYSESIRRSRINEALSDANTKFPIFRKP